MDTQEDSPNDARLPWFADGVTILDALGEDAAGKRILVQRADGARAQLVEPHEEAQSTLAFRERFKTKAARARAVRHENVAATLGYAEDAGVLFLAEEHVEGTTFADAIASGRRLDADAVLEVGSHVAAALVALHREGLVHGWVRPEAIVIAEDRALLRGCGLEHPKGEDASPPEFMSPEQVSEGRSLQPASDFFSLGSVLFAAMVGRPPFTGETPKDVAEAVRQGHISYPSPGEPALSKNQRLLFAKLLARDPEQRPRTAEELLGDLQTVREKRSIQRVTEVPPPPERRQHKRLLSPQMTATLGIGAVVVVAAAALLATVLLSREPPPEEPVTEPRPVAAGPTTPAAAAATAPANVVKPPEPKPPGPPELAQKLYDEANEYARAHPNNLDEIVERFDRVGAKYPGTPAALKATRRATDFELKRSGTRVSEFDAVQTQADRLVKEKRFGTAVEAFRRYATLRAELDGKLTQEVRDQVERQVSFVEAQAAESYTRASEEAAKAVKAKRYADAIAVYEQVAARYGIEEHVRSARAELAILRPLLAARAKVDAAEAAKAREKMYREAAAVIQERVTAFDLEKAVTLSEQLRGRLEGTKLEPNAASHLAHLRQLLALKSRVIKKINTAPQKLTCEALGIRAAGSVIADADTDGITLRSASGTKKQPWAKLSAWEKYAIVRSVSDLDSPDDVAALGLLSLEQGNRSRAGADLARAKRLGANVAALFARLKEEAAADFDPAKSRPARMLVEARALVAEKEWLDALVLLIPLKEKHAATDYAIRAKLPEINALLEQCAGAVARADIERDIAAGTETALLADGIAKWTRRGDGWALVGGRVSCDNPADHDVELLKPAAPVPAYRLSARCRVVEGKGLMLRVASDGDNQYDVWLELGDAAKSGLWHSSGGQVRKNKALPVRLVKGDWIVVRAIVTGRVVRVECGGQTVSLPNHLIRKAGTKWSYGFITRQKSTAEFEDFRLRVLQEQ